MTSIRLYAAGPLAMIATGGLFLFMQGLVASEGDVKIDPVPPKYIPVIQEIDNKPAKRKVRDVPKPPKVNPQPPRVIDPVFTQPDPTRIGPDIPHVQPAPNPDLIGLGQQADGDYLPLVRVSAQYPDRALRQGIEGYAVVELTVGVDGAVVPGSIMVVDAEPAGLFNKTAIKAAARFKYKPRVVGGTAQSVAGVRYRFSFNMSE